ncbi:MAG: hypothetical protein ACKVT0_07250 [Planctomycetaceae bacterium]
MTRTQPIRRDADSAITQVALVSPANGDECRNAVSTIERYLPHAEIKCFASLAELLNAGQVESPAAWFPDIGIISQSWPNQYPPRDVLGLLAMYPLTRWICRYGAWCDSDGRNRGIWPAAFRVPDCWGEIRIEREVSVLNNSRAPISATASLAEIFQFHYCPGSDRPVRENVRPLKLAIFSPDKAYRLSLEKLLATFGHRVVIHDTNRNCAGSASIRYVDAILWDCDPRSPIQHTWLNELRSMFTHQPDGEPQKPIIVGLLGMPLPDDEVELRAHGIQAVVAKLAPVEKLLAVLQELTAPSAIRRL